jgi:hypothetical protein
LIKAKLTEMLGRPPARRRKHHDRCERRRLAHEERERLDKQAADKRVYRHLIDDGGAVLKGLPVRDINGLIEALLDLHWLPEGQAEDRKAICAAVGALLDDIVSRHRSSTS